MVKGCIDLPIFIHPTVGLKRHVLVSCYSILNKSVSCSCEEFWAENPSGNQTDGFCNGISLGEPYRELRIYVNGQVAGFSPIYASIYTGGVAPR